VGLEWKALLLFRGPPPALDLVEGDLYRLIELFETLLAGTKAKVRYLILALLKSIPEEEASL
jgi:hypothetical protein